MRLTTIALFILLSTNVFAETLNQKKIKHINMILKSQEIKKLLDESEELALNGIQFSYLGRAAWGPANYEVNLTSWETDIPEKCKLFVDVDITNDTIMGMGELTCGTRAN